jgi:hypothetical protein
MRDTKIAPVEAEIFSELHKWERSAAVVAGVLVHPGHRDIQKARCVVNGEQFFVARRFESAKDSLVGLGG